MKNLSDSLSNRASFSDSRDSAQEECPHCGGVGFLRQDVPLDHPEFGKIVPCECRLKTIRTQRLKQLRRVSNMDSLAHYSFENFDSKIRILPYKSRSLIRAYQAAQKFADHPQGWLIILGGYGCGKTHLAAAIANRCLEQGRGALFVVVPDLLDHLRATYSPNSTASYDERFEEVRSAPLLILDDLGAHAGTQWAQEKLFQIFNHRYNARLPTVITSNQTLEEFDLRLRSRLADPANSRIEWIFAPDFRQSGGEGSDLSTLSHHVDKLFKNFDLRKGELDPNQYKNLKSTFETAKSYARDPKGWGWLLLFTGPSGCGKTHLAAAIANYRQEKSGKPALFVVVPDLLDHLRASFSPQASTSYDKRFEEVRNTPFLVLDALGTQSATPWAQEKLYQLFNHRYNARLPTVITMADKGVELDEQLKSRIFDVERRHANIRITASNYRDRPPKASQKSGPPNTRSNKYRSTAVQK